MGKGQTIEELTTILQLHKELGKKVVLCHGVFDIFHPGHLRYLQSSKKEGDILVVTITPDRFVNKGPGTPRFKEELRVEMVASQSIVDYVALNEWPTAIETILKLKPDVYCKGREYSNPDLDITGKISEEIKAVQSIGGIFHTTVDDIVFSSTSILNENFNIFPKKTKDFLDKIKKDWGLEKVLEIVDSFKDVKVLVIGDTIIDQYIYCSMLGASPKDNIITTRYIDEETFAGGVLAAANHLANFCNKVHLVTLIGRDGWEPYVRENLNGNIDLELLVENIPTTVKKKFVEPDSLNKMFGITNIIDKPTRLGFEFEVKNYLEKIIKDFDLVVVCDFGHGFIGRDLVEFLSSEAGYLAVNSQTNSANMGFNSMARYLSANYICMDELELRLACLDKFGVVEQDMERLRNLLGCEILTVTQGKHGSLTLTGGKDFTRVTCLSDELVDRVGAGDAYFSLTAPGAFKGLSPDLLGLIGNAAGALKVRRVNNKEPITKVQLYKFLTTLLK